MGIEKKMKIASFIISSVLAGAADYSVQGDNWEGICAEGQSQSPINIISEKAKSKYDWDIFRPTNYSRETTWDVQFDGGVKMVPRDAGIMLAGGHLVGDELNENQFVLAQAHFHWGDDDQAGSEHTLDGKQHFAEIHFVHYNAKYESLGTAYTESDGLAVLGFFIDVVEDENIVDNYFDTKLNSILETAQAKLESKDFGVSDEVDFSMRKRRSIEDDEIDQVFVTFTGAIAPDTYRLKNYYRYSGSLTTPTCDESVQWTVFHEPLVISRATADLLYSTDVVTAPDKNFRHTQPVNGRKVTYYHSNLLGSSLGTNCAFGLVLALLLIQ